VGWIAACRGSKGKALTWTKKSNSRRYKNMVEAVDQRCLDGQKGNQALLQSEKAEKK